MASSAAASAVKSVGPLGFPFKTQDPFLFCVYHKDLYPAGNASNMFAPRKGNGADFDWSAPYRMYHGDRLPGFPQHPHRGFETLTLVQEGVCDHTDSLGAAGRYGGDGRRGDLQWMTAGAGCVHGENFPLVKTDRPNTLRLFQICERGVTRWACDRAAAQQPISLLTHALPLSPLAGLNLPAKSKFAPPGYKMSWAEEMVFVAGERGAECEVAAGRLGAARASAPPPPHSWAAEERNDVGVYYVTLPPGGGRFVLPAAAEGAAVSRSAYVVEAATAGASGVSVGGRAVPAGGRATFELRGESECELLNEHASEPAHVLVLQGRPIAEPVAQHGPFVMNTQAEIRQAFADYQRTQFGGWPWPEDAVAFPRGQGRFADMIVNGVKVREEPPARKGDGGAGDAAAAPAAAPLSPEAMSVKQLKAALAARGVPIAGLAEKDDLVAALVAAGAAAGAAGAAEL